MSRAYLNHGRLLRLAAARHPERPFLIYGDRRVSYGEFNSRVNQIANGLAAAGVASQDCVLTWAYNSDELLALLFATAKLGAVAAPVNTMLTRDSVNALIDRLAPKAIAADGPQLLQLEEMGVKVDVGMLLEADGAAISVDSAGRWPTIAAFADGQSTDEPTVSLPSDDSPGMILFTSGSTGLPRGVVKSFANLCWHGINLQLSEPRYADSVEFVGLQLAGIMFANFVITDVLAGATVLLARRFHPRNAVEEIERHGGSHMFLAPTMLMPLLDAAADAGASLSSIRLLETAYAITPAQRKRLIESLPACRLLYGYGCTEGTTFRTPAECFDDESGLVGRATGLDEFRVVGKDGGPVAEGEAGEIQLYGPSVMKGYLEHEDGVITETGWLRPGDLGAIDADGMLHFRGRVKDMIKTGGHNVFASDVEDALASHPAVEEACVVGVPDDRWGESVIAVIRPAASRAHEDDITAFLRDKLPGFARPKRLFYMDDFPLNPSGKIAKGEIQKLAETSASSPPPPGDA